MDPVKGKTFSRAKIENRTLVFINIGQNVDQIVLFTEAENCSYFENELICKQFPFEKQNNSAIWFYVFSTCLYIYQGGGGGGGIHIPIFWQ